MAIKLPKYQKQVGVASGAETVQMVDPSVATAGIRAAGQALDSVTNMGAEYAMKLKKHKDEGDLIGYENRYSVWESELELKKKDAKLSGVKDEDIMDKVIVPAMNDFQKSIENENYSKGVSEIVTRDFGAKSQMLDVAQRAEVVQNYVIKSNIEKSNYAINAYASGNTEEAERVFSNLEESAKPEQIDRWRKEAKRQAEYAKIDAEKAQADAEKAQKQIASADLNRDIFNNPSATLGLINKQLSGDEQYFSVDDKTLKSSAAYAKQIINERKNESYDELYTPDSDYAKMNKNQKQDYIDDMYRDGMMSAKSWKAENRRINEPTLMDVTPEDNKSFVEFQRKLYSASGDQKLQMQILDDITSSGMPEEMRRQLYGLQRDMISPSGKTNQATFKYGLETLNAVFGREDIVGEAPWWTFGFGDIKEETREDLRYRAEAEARSEFVQWYMSTPDVTEAKATQKVYDIIGEKSKEYTLQQIPTRLEEQIIEPMVEVEPAVEPTVDAMSREDFISDFMVEEGREPTEDELEQLRTQGYWR